MKRKNRSQKHDEYIEKFGDSLWRIQGAASLDEVAEELDIELPLDEYDTFGGYVLGALGSIPEDGTSFCMETEQLDIKVENICGHCAESLIVSIKKTEAEAT